MKHITFFCSLLLLMGGCAKATLIDQTMTSFTASASQDKADRITITWATNAFYKSYEVIRSQSRNGTFESVSGIISGSTFDDMAIPRGVSFYYKVRGFNSLGIPMFTTIEPVIGIAGSAAFMPPTTLEVSQGTSLGSILLKWERVDEATSYDIYRSSTGLKDTFKKITNTPYLEFEDRTAENGGIMNPGDVYYYKISSVGSDGFPSGSRYPFTEEGLKGSTFGGSAGFVSQAGKYADRIELTWNSVANTKEYVIYRSAPNDKNNMGSPIATVGADVLSFIDRSVDPGAVYYYTLFLRGSHELMQIPSEKIKSYLKSSSAPGTPQNLTVSQGDDAQYVKLIWDPVAGATLYEVSRSLSPDGPWEDLSLVINTDSADGKQFTKDDPYTDASVESFSYYYRVAAGNPALGEPTVPMQGWANKPPANIKASKIYGGRINLTWDSVPKAEKYLVSYSESPNGVYTSAGTHIPSAGSGTESFDHALSISEREKSFYYKIQVTTSRGDSFPSNPVEGRIAKISAPQGLVVPNNTTTADSVIKLGWDEVPNAVRYQVYRATLAHRFAEISNLRASDYVLVGEPENNAFQDSLTSYPLRRYDYQILALDPDGAKGEAVYTKDVVSTADKSVYRLPKDTMEFMKDVDKTIIEAQSRINNFGGMGSSGTPMGRAAGKYEYLAGTSAISSWSSFTSFEVTLDGATSFSVSTGDMSATQSGPVQVSGLYTGTITYNSLKGLLGGYTSGGTIKVSYKGESKTYNYNDLSSLDNIVLTTESKPGYPSYNAGGGGNIQPGWSR